MTVFEPARSGIGAPILVTGAGGRLGRLLFRAAQARGVLDRFIWQSRHAGARAGVWVQDDLNQPQALLARLGSLSGILHLAGGTPATIRDDEMISANVDLALRMVDAAAGRRLFLLSSAAVYGRSCAQLLREDQALSPQSEYARSKTQMEAQVHAAGGQNICVLRLGNVAGADALLGQCANGMQGPLELDVFDTGRGPARSYIGPGRFADVILRLCDHPGPLPPVLNIATPSPVTMDALLESWVAHAPGERPFSPRPARPTTIERVALDTAALQRIVSFDAAASEPVHIIRDLLGVLGARPC